MLGHLAKARYLGSASGGTFASSMISYTDPEKLTENFGKYTPPEYATVAGMQVGGQSLLKGSGLVLPVKVGGQSFLKGSGPYL